MRDPEFKIKNFKEISSTNQKAKKLAFNGAAPWLVVVAEKQIAGYGKGKVPWFSPQGGLYFSIILPKSKVDEHSFISTRRPLFGEERARVIEDLQTLTILAAFIVAKVIKENFNLEPFIKLPNDVWVNGKKIAGILTENVIGQEVKLSVIGIGLNTNIEKFPKELENSATSLKIELGREVNNEKILKKIFKELKEQLKTISE